MVRLNHDQTTLALTAAFSYCALIRRDSNELNHNQTLSLLLAQAVQQFNVPEINLGTMLLAACSGCTEVRRCSNESNHDQTTLTAACLGCAFVWRGSSESRPNQTTLSAACSVQHKQRVPCESSVWFDSFESVQTTVKHWQW